MIAVSTFVGRSVDQCLFCFYKNLISFCIADTV